MYRLCILIFCLAIYSPAFSQCKNSISVKKTSKEVNSVKTGALEVKIVSEGRFVCHLKSEEGSGTKKIQNQDGSGTSTVRFEGLDTNKIYLVEVEFQSVDQSLCKRLQKSQIVFE